MARRPPTQGRNWVRIGAHEFRSQPTAARLGGIDTTRPGRAQPVPTQTGPTEPDPACDHDRGGLPGPRRMVRHAWPHVLEGSMVPFVLFAVAVRFWGLMAGLLVALGWSLAALGRRVWRGHRVSGILLLGTLTLTCRTLLTIGSGNLAIYFVPPLVTTLALAGAFVVSVPLGTPLSWRLANDLWPIGDHALGDPTAGRVFRRLCWFWALVNVAKLVLNLWLLASLPTATYAVVKGGVSAVLMGGGVVVSYLWLRKPLAALRPVGPCAACLVPLPVLAGPTVRAR